MLLHDHIPTMNVENSLSHQTTSAEVQLPPPMEIYSLFGTSIAVVDSVVETPVVNLELTLTATFTHPEQAKSYALVEKNSTVARYYPGNEIEPGVELVAIDSGLIILHLNGRFEQLISGIPDTKPADKAVLQKFALINNSGILHFQESEPIAPGATHKVPTYSNTQPAVVMTVAERIQHVKSLRIAVAPIDRNLQSD